MKRLRSVVHQIDPHVVDVRTLALIGLSFGAGVFLITWQSASLRLDIEGINVAWMALVAFGLSWYAGWGTGWRVGAGLVLGVVASLATFYAAMSFFPVTRLGVGIALAIGAAVTAVLCHVIQRLFSFAAAAVGFGAGIAIARAVPIRPTTPVDDLFALITGAVLAAVIGALGSLILRTLVIRAGKTQRLGRFVPVLHLSDENVEVPKSLPNGGRPTAAPHRSAKRAAGSN